MGTKAKPCDCRPSLSGGMMSYVAHCPVHKAAPYLANALRALLEALDGVVVVSDEKELARLAGAQIAAQRALMMSEGRPVVENGVVRRFA